MRKPSSNSGSEARHPRIRVTDLEAALGTRYTADTVDALKRRFPDAEVHRFADAGHYVLEDAEEVVPLIRGFLEKNSNGHKKARKDTKKNLGLKSEDW